MKQKLDQLVDSYISFQAKSASPFHVVSCLQAELEKNNFTSLSLKDSWSLTASRAYYCMHPEGKSLVAFQTGRQSPEKEGFSAVCSHTDSPNLRLRLLPWQEDHDYLLALTQMHGGLIQRSWFDRPLVLAGALYYAKRPKKKSASMSLDDLKRELVLSKEPLALIPDIAIHLDRDKNKSGAIDAETMLTAFLGQGAKEKNIKKLWSRLSKTKKEPDGFELSFAPFFPQQKVGLDQEFLLGPRHDDLAMVFTSSQAFLSAIKKTPSVNKTRVVAFFDAEETGSMTSSGAASNFFPDVLERIAVAHPKSQKSPSSYRQALASSFLISADMAHAYHPSYPQKHDRNHRPKINKGLVLKENANDRYATSGLSATVFKELCLKAKAPMQHFVSRQDMGCGSTIGPSLAAELGCPTVDVGLAMWGMHSCGETMGTSDLIYAVDVFKQFFS